MKSGDFFDAENFPKLTFASTSMEKVEDENYTITGDLTIKGTTKQVIFKAEFGGTTCDFYGNTKAGFDILGKINRQDLDLTWGAVT